MSYLGFIAENRRFLAFGFLLTLVSSFGQTFFIALFSAELREAFGLGHGGFGTVFALATLTSAVLMVPAGQLIDRFDLRAYSATVAAAMALACLGMAAAPAGSLASLYLVILLLRLAGQGLMSHTAVTSMARYFERGRGRAVAVASLGHAAGEAVLPTLAVALLAATHWRTAWTAIGAGLAIGLVPLVLWLLRGHGVRHRALLQRLDGGGDGARQWSRREVLGDRRFHLLLPAFLAPAFINTGIVFNQVHLVESKGWTLGLFAGAFATYAAAKVVAALLTGPLLERRPALRLFPYAQLPLALGVLALSVTDHPAAAFAYLTLAGISTGGFLVVTAALWAEVYGSRHLGAIRAMTTSMMVLSSALAPAAMGWLIDAGVSIEAICAGCLAWILAAAMLAARARRPAPGLRAERRGSGGGRRGGRRDRLMR